MTRTPTITLTIGSTTNCRTRTNVPTNTVFTVGANTALIIARFGTFMTMPMDIRDTIIIRGLTITAPATATAIEVGSLRANNVAILGTREGIEMSRNTIAMAALAVLTMAALATSAEAHPKLE